MGLAQASGSEEWAVSSTVSMQAEVTAALINAASKVAPFPSQRGRLIVFAPTSFHPSTSTLASLPLLRTIGLVSAQPQAILVLGLSASQPPPRPQHLINIDTCGLRVAATTSLPLSPPSRHPTTRLPSTLRLVRHHA
jgi:hypothetical protein